MSKNIGYTMFSKKILILILLLVCTFSECPEGKEYFGNTCFSEKEYHECSEHLGLLDPNERYDP